MQVSYMRVKLWNHNNQFTLKYDVVHTQTFMSHRQICDTLSCRASVIRERSRENLPYWNLSPVEFSFLFFFLPSAPHDDAPPTPSSSLSKGC